MHVELWGIVRSLQIAVVNNITSLVVETSFIPPVCPLLEDIVVLASCVPYISWSHYLRETNFVVDNLAKKGHDIPFGLHLFEAAPLDTAMMIMRDLSGSPILRDSIRDGHKGDEWRPPPTF
ncbi:hypothetical protein Ahy_B01g055467 [Arachis hypogaea]|uniref:RNase H type-1 domain-containing protein n=1 Tax=Arachis hypogaea TaxID=3818 RepID=A0A445AWB2_ARAHY|nr:hypothetical protein Ahy_B01g055467 [Arachis hypogaea]